MDYSFTAQKLRDIQAMARRIDQQAAVAHMALLKEDDRRVIEQLKLILRENNDMMNALDEATP